MTSIYGGFDGTETDRNQRDWEKNVTVVDGNSSVRVFLLKKSTTIDGLTIANGFFQSHGGGIYVDSYTTLVIANCTLMSNRSSGYYGGGIYNGAYTRPNITNCTFVDNTAEYGGGIFNDTGSTPVINNCTFENNTATNNAGGGVYNSSSTSSLINNSIFTANTGTNGSAIYNGSNSTSLITNSIFNHNLASSTGGGGIYTESPTMIITNSTFFYNSGAYGGAIFNGATLTLMNCSLSDNVAYTKAGGIYNVGVATITNSILWDNGEEIYNGGDASATVTYSDVEGGYDGDGNIDSNPLFVHAEPGPTPPDLHLTANSPAIDTGTSDGAPNTDLEGNPRPQGEGFDMGAYEYMSVPSMSLVLSPASGQYFSTQGFDLGMIVTTPGLSVVNINATSDGSNVSTPLSSCVRPGTLTAGGQTFRCPSLNAGTHLGNGSHTLSVTLDLNDGSSVSDEVIWEVLENQE